MFGENQTAVVTGGNRGIGEAIARTLAARKMNLVIAALGDEQNERVAQSIQSEFGVRVKTLDVDVSEEVGCRRIFETAIAVFGSIELLVNNVGIWAHGKVAESDSDTFDRVMRTNLYSTYWCSREAYSRMLANETSGSEDLRGAIINISSRAGVAGLAGVGLYCASKHAVMGLTRAMAKEGAEDRIRVAAICPSLVSKPDGRFSGPKLIAIEDVTSTLDYLLHLSSAAWPTEIVLERRKS